MLPQGPVLPRAACPISCWGHLLCLTGFISDMLCVRTHAHRQLIRETSAAYPLTPKAKWLHVCGIKIYGVLITMFPWSHGPMLQTSILCIRCATMLLFIWIHESEIIKEIKSRVTCDTLEEKWTILELVLCQSYVVFSLTLEESGSTMIRHSVTSSTIITATFQTLIRCKMAQ